MKMKSKVFSIVGVLLLQMSGLATVVPAAVKEGSSSVTNRFMVDSEAKAMKYNPMISDSLSSTSTRRCMEVFMTRSPSLPMKMVFVRMSSRR